VQEEKKLPFGGGGETREETPCHGLRGLERATGILFVRGGRSLPGGKRPLLRDDRLGASRIPRGYRSPSIANSPRGKRGETFLRKGRCPLF